MKLNEKYEDSDDTEQSYCDNDDIERYSPYYTESGFWNKIKKHYKKIGVKLIYIAVTLFFTLRDSDTPKWAKTIIIGALGYFILPLDVLPDFMPVFGFTDDIASIALALGAVSLHIKEEHKEQSKDIIDRIFNNSRI